MLEQIQLYAKPVVTAEQLLACLFAEHQYWLRSEEADDEGTLKTGTAIGATSALANVIAFATIVNHRAEWQPEKSENSSVSIQDLRSQIEHMPSLGPSDGTTSST